jgi:hypothetical protein
MVSFGGLLTIGGGYLHCVGCGGEFFQQIGGLSVVQQLVASTRLRGTEFAPSSFVFGGAVGSDGAALLNALGLPPIPVQEEQGVVRLQNSDQHVRLGFDAHPSHQELQRSPTARHFTSLRQFMKRAIRRVAPK